MMAGIYLVSFAAAWFQNIGLMGQDGLEPASDLMNRLHIAYPNPMDGFLHYPAIFWWLPVTDFNLQVVNGLGLGLSALALGLAINSWLVQLALWMLYFSVVTIVMGSSFYQYGWESQILETGFLCIFLCELPSWDKQRNKPRWALWEDKQHQHSSRPTAIILWLFQWLIFRISTGAGLIKVRGSSCWTDKTCLYYHFETQPIPSPLSFLYHFAPKAMQRGMVNTDLVVQLYTAWLVLFPACTALWLPLKLERGVRFLLRLGGALQAGFMVGILLSGNFSVLNHLTIIPALACLDDACWPQFLRLGLCTTEVSLTKRRLNGGERKSNRLLPPQHIGGKMPLSRRIVDTLLFCLILKLSRPVIDNLFQRGDHRRQVMNASFDPFRLVNTYGAFGSVGKARYEAIVQISDDGYHWQELEFPCKPGGVHRRPCFCAPYHYRVDWNIWFLGFKPHKHYLQSRESWLFALLLKLLQPDKAERRPWLDLLDPSSARYLKATYYNEGKAPQFVKVDMYHYKMAHSLWKIMSHNTIATIHRQNATEKLPWWNRTFEENLVRPLSLGDIGPRGR